MSVSGLAEHLATDPGEEGSLPLGAKSFMLVSMSSRGSFRRRRCSDFDLEAISCLDPRC